MKNATQGLKRYTCRHCGSTNIELSIPCWVTQGAEWQLVDLDSDAEPRAYYCRDCEDGGDYPSFVFDAPLEAVS
jgi:hypothetical protein